MNASGLVYVGLGSNLEDPVRQLTQAFDELGQIPETHLRARSHLYKSAPVGPAGQPDYINAVAALETGLEPHALLAQLQAIEQLHHRKRLERWGPRTLDLDLLWFGGQQIGSETLVVPHPEIQYRNFVLIPWLEIAPDMIMLDNRPLSAWVEDCGHAGLERLAQ